MQDEVFFSVTLEVPSQYPIHRLDDTSRESIRERSIIDEIDLYHEETLSVNEIVAPRQRLL